MNKFAKSLFVLTSLAPVLGAYVVNDLSQGKPFLTALFWLIPALLLMLICWLLIVFATRRLAKEQLIVTSVRSTDKETLAYLVAYLLPIISKDMLDFRTNLATTAFVFSILFIAIYHSNAFHFNPLLGLVGYHFYEVQADDSITYMLITRRVIRRQKITMPVVEMACYVYLDVEEPQ